MKTRKAIAKRFKITKTGKVLRRVTGQCHLKAKKTGKRKIAGKKWVKMSAPEAKKIKKLIRS